MSELLAIDQQFHPVFFGKAVSKHAASVLRERFNAFCQGHLTVYISPMVGTDTLLPSVRPHRLLLADSDRNVVDTMDWFRMDAERLRQKYTEKVASMGEEEYSVFRKQFNRLKAVTFAEKASLYLALMRWANKGFAPYDADGNFVATYLQNNKTDADFCAAVEALFATFAVADAFVTWKEIDYALMEAVDMAQSDNADCKAVVYIDMRYTGHMFAERAKIAAYCTMAVNRMRGDLKVFILTYDVKSFTTMFAVNPVSEPLKHKVDDTDKKAIPEVIIEVG